MSDRYCIDKILEKPKQESPETLENFTDDPDVIHEKALSLIQVRREERRSHEKRNPRNEERRSPDDREKSSIFVHVPRDAPRSYASDPYQHISSLCYPRVGRCYCPGCSQESVPPWLKRAPSPQFVSVDKRLGPRAFTHHPYSIRNERDYGPLSNNSLATRTRQQSSSRTTGGSKKKKRHRTAFTPTQLLGLENAFEQSHYSVGEERKQLAAFLGLSETQIKVWFQNRRTKWKRIRKEAEEEDSDEDEAEGDSCYEANYPAHEAHHHYHYNSGHHEHGHEHGTVLAYQKRWRSHHPWAGDHRYPF